ncbi:MAG: hypothetical protein ACYDH9_20200 [Limisphaerales bacterium]
MPQHAPEYAGSMDTGNTSSQNIPAEDGEQLAVEPLKPKRTPRTVMEMERLLAALQVAMGMDLNSAKQEILHRLRAVESSVELMAQDMARKEDDPTRR